MSLSKKLVYGLIFIEIQVILIGLIFLIPKVLEVEKKVERTNRFMFNVIQEKSVAGLQTVREDDIILGDRNALATMIVYTKFGCSACHEFYTDNLGKLKSNYVDKGLLKIVLRYLTHSGNKEAFNAAKGAHYTYSNDAFSAYNKIMHDDKHDLSLVNTKKAVLSILPDSSKFDSYINNAAHSNKITKIATEAINAGVRKTPTILINGQKLVGNRRYQKLEQLINESI